MANTQAMCTSFKVQLLNGSHAFGTQAVNSVRTVTTKDTFNGALYTTTATLSEATTVYTSSGELAATGNYTAKGALITNANAPSSTGTTAFWTPSASLSWAALTSSAAFDALLIINNKSTSGAVELAVSVHTFSSQSVTAGTFTLTMPTNDSSTGLIRIA